MCPSVDLHAINHSISWSSWSTIFDHLYWRSIKFIKSRFFSPIDDFMKEDVFITTIKIRLGFAISFVINQVINFVFRIDTADTIGLKRFVLCAKKRVADQSIIIKKNVMSSEIGLKIAFEKNITITKSNATLERTSLIMKTRISS